MIDNINSIFIHRKHVLSSIKTYRILCFTLIPLNLTFIDDLRHSWRHNSQSKDCSLLPHSTYASSSLTCWDIILPLLTVTVIQCPSSWLVHIMLNIRIYFCWGGRNNTNNDMRPLHINIYRNSLIKLAVFGRTDAFRTCPGISLIKFFVSYSSCSSWPDFFFFFFFFTYFYVLILCPWFMIIGSFVPFCLALNRCLFLRSPAQPPLHRLLYKSPP